MRRQHAVLSAIATILVTGWWLRGSWFDASVEAGAVAVVRETSEIVIPAEAGPDADAPALVERETSERVAVPVAESDGDRLGFEASKAELTGRLLLRETRLAPLTFIVRCEPLDRKPEDYFAPRSSSRVEDSVAAGDEYRFEGLAIGKYSLQVSPVSLNWRESWDAWLLVDKEVLLEPGRNRVDLLVDPIGFQNYLQLQCLDPQGQTVQAEGIVFRMRTTLGGIQDQSPQSLPLKSGAHLVDLPDGWLRPDEVQDGIELLVLVASHGTYSDASLALRADQREAVLRFSEPAGLDLRIGNVPARLRGRLRVRVEPASLQGVTNPMREIGPPPGEDGVFRFAKLEVGDSRVEIYLHSEGSINSYQRALVGTHQVKISAGTQVLTIPCPELYDVAVHNPGGWEGREFFLERVAGPGSVSFERPQSAKLSSGLRLDFLDCPAGDYLLRCGMLALPVTVPCAEVLLQD